MKVKFNSQVWPKLILKNIILGVQNCCSSTHLFYNSPWHPWKYGWNNANYNKFADGRPAILLNLILSMKFLKILIRRKSTLEKISLIINVNPTYQRTPLFSIYKHGKTLLSLNKALCSYLATLWARAPWCKTDFIQSSYFTDFLVLKILSIVELLLLAVIAPASNLKTMQLNHQIMDEGSVDVMLT